MNYIDRYVHAACGYLPLKQRAEAESKIRKRIEEMIIVRKNIADETETEEERVRAVLEELGSPARLADEYRKSPRCLIGPGLIDTYWLILKIALLASAIGLVIALGIQMIVDPMDSAWQTIIKIFGDLYQALITSFGMVTLVFALIQHLSGDDLPRKNKINDLKWQIDQLPLLPESKIRIKRSDPIVSIIFALVFLIIINISPELFGYYQQTAAGINIIPLLGESFKTLLIWINLVIVLGIILDIIKTAYGRWTYFLVFSCLGHNVISLIVALLVLRSPALINPDFNGAITELFQQSGSVLPERWIEYTLSVISVLVIIGFAIESITIIAKAFHLAQIRYGQKTGGANDNSAISQ